MVNLDNIPLTDDARLVKYSREISSENDVSRQNDEWKRTDLSADTWSEHVLIKFHNLLKTHTLNIDMIPKSIGRARRHRHHMLPMMAFGITEAGLFMVPMGFQFLAVLAGKALLLSKMALLLASINGLKRVASSGVHYGLYHADRRKQHYWDRGDSEHPRSQM